MNKLNEILGTAKPLLGMIHFPPLIGHKDFPGFDYIATKMLSEAKILEDSGYDAIIIENNYDTPHTEKITPMSAAMFGALAKILENKINIPFGVDILWNDFETSLSVCASSKAKFFRVPAFVDSVKTDYGVMEARADAISELRKRLNLENIGLFADIQVKHSEMLDKNKSLSTSVKEAKEKSADAVIVTGKWTGDAPKIEDLKEVKTAVGDFPILIGSGSTIENLKLLSMYADGVIVGTFIKDGENQDKEKEINLKPFEATISKEKASDFAKEFKSLFK